MATNNKLEKSLQSTASRRNRAAFVVPETTETEESGETRETRETRGTRETRRTRETRGARATLASQNHTISVLVDNFSDSIVARARAHIGESYVLGARAPMADPDWKGPWDCAEFASWCVYQATGILFGVEPRHDPIKADAFTGYWGEQARQAGTVISVEQAARIAGACVLRVPQSGRTGHIVISDGQGGTVEAHSAAKGVIAGTLSGRRWDMGILVPGVRYFTAEEPVVVKAPIDILRYTEPMLRGPRIEHLQQCLAKLGYPVGRPDGVFGPQTEAAVQAFQSAEGLVADGEVGKKTLAALDKRCKGK